MVNLSDGGGLVIGSRTEKEKETDAKLAKIISETAKRLFYTALVANPAVVPDIKFDNRVKLIKKFWGL